jgi:hypothetical protein
MPRPMKPTLRSRVPTHEEISQCAYDIFVARGALHGFDQEHWFEAEQLLVTNGTVATALSDDYERTPDKRPRRPRAAAAPTVSRRRAPSARDSKG